jgi:hypothetical protein
MKWIWQQCIVYDSKGASELLTTEFAFNTPHTHGDPTPPQPYRRPVTTIPSSSQESVKPLRERPWNWEGFLLNVTPAK